MYYKQSQHCSGWRKGWWGTGNAEAATVVTSQNPQALGTQDTKPRLYAKERKTATRCRIAGGYKFYSHLKRQLQKSVQNINSYVPLFWWELLPNIWRIPKIKNGVLLLCSLCFLMFSLLLNPFVFPVLSWVSSIVWEKWLFYTQRKREQSKQTIPSVLHNEFWSTLPSFRLGSGFYHLYYLGQIT